MNRVTRRKSFFVVSYALCQFLYSCTNESSAVLMKTEGNEWRPKLDEVKKILTNKGFSDEEIEGRLLQGIEMLKYEKGRFINCLLCRDSLIEDIIIEEVNLLYDYAKKIQKFSYDEKSYYYFLEFGGAQIRKETWNQIQKNNKNNPIKLMLGCGQSFIPDIHSANNADHNHYGYITFDLDAQKINNTDIRGDLKYTIDFIYDNSCSEIVSEYLTKDVFTKEFVYKMYNKLAKGGEIVIIGGGIEFFKGDIIKELNFKSKYLDDQTLILKK